MTCRRATASDAEALLGLYQVLVGDAEIAGRESVVAVLEHPGSEIWCVESEKTLVGMATLHILPNVTQRGRPYAVVENVVTAPNSRGQGVGRRVIEAVISSAWAADAYKIMLMTGQSTNARGFYEALGFASDEKWAMTLRRAPIREGR